jgi:exosortase
MSAASVAPSAQPDLLPSPRGIAVAVCCVAVAMGAAYFSALAEIVHQWQSDEDMAHGFFVPLIAGYVVWERWSAVRQAAAPGFARNRLGLVLVLWAALQMAVGTLGAELFLQRTSFLIALSGAILYFFGGKMIRTLAFPLILLLFMIPVPGIVMKSITFPLQLLASSLAEKVLDLAGYSVLREGNILNLAGQQLSVAEACSGLRALMSLSFFSVCYAYLFDPRVSMRWLLLAAAIPTALVANAGRIVITGVLASFDQKLATGVFHSLSGWAIFLIAITLLVGIKAVLVRLLGRPAEELR